MEVLCKVFEENKNVCRVAGGLAVAATGLLAYRWIRGRTDSSEGDYPRDTVILQQMGRGPFAPSLVPFAVKLETYLRFAKIPYENRHDLKYSRKGKLPWISYNGQDVDDSAFCIEFLNKQYGLDLNSWLTPEQRAVALAFQRMTEENLYWAMVDMRWVQDVDMEFVQYAVPKQVAGWMFTLMMQPKLRKLSWGGKMTWAQGMGRHSKTEVLHIARRDLTALSDFLGTKKFLMGDQPCEQDCAIFGQLSQFYWQLPRSAGAMFKEEFPRLVAYCERMKDAFWPDWTECTTQGGKVKATK